MLIRTSSLSLVFTRSSQTSKWPVALVQGRHLLLLGDVWLTLSVLVSQ